MSTVYEYTAKALDGKEIKLEQYKGNVMLIVNTASKCGFTSQFAGLEKLHEEYSKRGLSLLGFPCNQFGAQEPGSPEEITTFCSTNYGVTFPMTEKVDVNGDSRHELYKQLTPVPDAEGHSGDIRWNFEKFLVGKDGNVVARFGPMVAPDDNTLREAIRTALR
jgi:glutathione peroxidase